MVKAVKGENFLTETTEENNYERNSKDQEEENWKSENLQGEFSCLIADVSNSMSWLWMVSSSVKKSTKAILTGAQDLTLGTNWIKANVGNILCSQLWRICYVLDESAMHVASGYAQIAKKRFELRHDLTATRIDWELCHK